MIRDLLPSQNGQRLPAGLLLLALILALPACAKRPRSTKQANDQQSTPAPQTTEAPTQQTPQRININTASNKELESLPGIGKGLAERIIAHRQKYGPFRRPEQLIIVRGISDKRFRALRDFITVE